MLFVACLLTLILNSQEFVHKRNEAALKVNYFGLFPSPKDFFISDYQ